MEELNPADDTPAYLCGRLLAVLERIQREALGKDLSSTIVDRYYGTASSAPASVFGRLLRGVQPHLSKIRGDKSKGDTAKWLERDLREILDPFEYQGKSFPSTLNAIQQGMFALGFYHQKSASIRAAIAGAQQKKERLQSARVTTSNVSGQNVFLLEVIDGNPNGDPDAGNLPRTDPETMNGLISDVCIKRKVRNWVDITHGTEDRFKIYVQDKGIALNDLHQRAYVAKNITSTGPKQKREDVDQVRPWMCENFYDIRTFGAVMNTQFNCGQVRGPVQILFARSINPIVPLDLAITRVAITQQGTDKSTEMGRKPIVPYGLYLGRGFYTPHFAKQTSFSREDLGIFWQALRGAWELDRAASRGMMSLRGLYVFSHENPLGNAPAHRLFDRISVRRKDGVQAPRCIADYTIEVNQAALPPDITFTDITEEEIEQEHEDEDQAS